MTSAHPRRGSDERSRMARAFGPDDRLPIDPDLDPGDPAEPAPGHRPATAPARRIHTGVLVAVGLGGFLGALARYEIQLAWPVRGGGFPSTTLVVNTSGAFLLGLILTVSMARPRSPAWRYVRFFACVGVLGAWTTMSTIAVEADTLVKGGTVALAGGYLAATVAAGVTAAALGSALARVVRR